MSSFTLDVQKIQDIRDGLHLVNLAVIEGNSGQPIEAGLVVTEHNPSYHPIEARGYLGESGTFQKVALHSAAQSRLQRRKKSLAGVARQATLRRVRLPEHLRRDPKALEALLRQEEYCHRLWARWRRPEGLDLVRWSREAVLTAPVDGFYLGELRADLRIMEFSDGQHLPVYDFDLPHYRAPSSVRAWLFQGDDVIGVVLEGAMRSQFDAVPSQEGTLSVLPASKFLLISRDRIGAQVEGQSELRSVAQHIKLHLRLLEIEALGVERHTLGELFFKQLKDGAEYLSPEDQAKLDQYSADRHAGLKTTGMSLPMGVEPELFTPGSQMPDVDGPLSRHWKAIFMGMGAEDRLVGADGTGAFAARKQASDDASAEDTDDFQQFFAEPLRELMARAIRWSGLDYGREEYLFVPEIIAAPIHDDVSPLELAQALATARTAGLLPKWSDEDEAALRARLGF